MGIEDRMRAMDSVRWLAIDVCEEEAAEVLLDAVRAHVWQPALVADFEKACLRNSVKSAWFFY